MSNLLLPVAWILLTIGILVCGDSDSPAFYLALGAALFFTGVGRIVVAIDKAGKR